MYNNNNNNNNIVPNLYASCQQTCMTLPLLCVLLKTPDDEQSNCPRNVEFYYKNQIEKFVYLVGFIITIYHDARSAERKSTSAGL